ncbi:MAG: efflux RND transporter periplasmic adaptor subunit [Burkholderiales bacterium]|nr:efflux RND transporter periplasmic adaptor subunit [Burkholderiales bacterium]
MNNRILPALALAVALVACNPSSGPAPAAGGGPPPAEVGVVTAMPRAVPLTTELPGRLEASRVAQVRARAAGILLKREFREGSDVKAGQLLFRIDPAPYAATLASAQATLQRAQANLTQAAAQAERFKPLADANAISQQEFINAVAARQQAEADVAAAKAAVQTAQINLGYASVTAPIGGRIGRALVTEGALVGQGEATHVATIQQIDPMYLNVTQSTTELLRLRRALDSGRLAAAGGPGAARVRVVLDDGSVYPLPGTLLFSDLTVDPSTGQITLRATVPNPKGLLLPGMYVRARLEQAVAEDAITLPQQAVSRGPTGDSVMVVGTDGQVAPRKVTVGAAQGGEWVILDGLKAGEQVMVDGFQKLRGNAPVKPVPWAAPASAPGAASAAASGPAPGAAAASAAMPASAPPAAAAAASR